MSVHNRPTAIERAFELARAGEVADMDDLRSVLRQEGYLERDIEGRSLGSQLRDLIKSARQQK
jgi:hypothetical protein